MFLYQPNFNLPTYSEDEILKIIYISRINVYKGPEPRR